MGWMNLITPQGGTMVGHGEEAHFPFQVITAQGPVWLTRVPQSAVPHLLKAGTWWRRMSCNPARHHSRRGAR